MKTIEERAAEAIASFVAKEQSLLYGKGGYGASFAEWSSRLGEEIEKAMRELVEDAAKIADIEAESVVDDKAFSSADTIARNIRALGEPKTEESNEVEDRFKPGGFWTT